MHLALPCVPCSNYCNLRYNYVLREILCSLERSLFGGLECATISFHDDLLVKLGGKVKKTHFCRKSRDGPVFHTVAYRGHIFFKLYPVFILYVSLNP